MNFKIGSFVFNFCSIFKLISMGACLGSEVPTLAISIQERNPWMHYHLAEAWAKECVDPYSGVQFFPGLWCDFPKQYDWEDNRASLTLFQMPIPKGRDSGYLCIGMSRMYFWTQLQNILKEDHEIYDLAVQEILEVIDSDFLPTFMIDDEFNKIQKTLSEKEKFLEDIENLGNMIIKKGVAVIAETEKFTNESEVLEFHHTYHEAFNPILELCSDKYFAIKNKWMGNWCRENGRVQKYLKYLLENFPLDFTNDLMLACISKVTKKNIMVYKYKRKRKLKIIKSYFLSKEAKIINIRHKGRGNYHLLYSTPKPLYGIFKGWSMKPIPVWKE